MKIKYSIILACAITLLSSCDYSEDELQPSNEKTSYSVPQGNHPYDQTIVNIFNKYGTYILYDFTDKDAYWTPGGWLNGMEGEYKQDGTGGKAGFTMVKADENYVGQQLDLLQQTWFGKFNDKMLDDLLPTKILLCSEVNEIVNQYGWDANGYWSKYLPTPVNAWYNYDNICVNYGNADVQNLTDAQKKQFSTDVIIEWIKYMNARKLTVPDEFATSVDYSKTSNIYSPKEAMAAGITANGYNTDAPRDWQRFMEIMVKYTYDWLTEDPGDISNWTSWASQWSWNTESDDWHGCLNIAKDTNGVMKKRYEIVRQYFIDNYGMDLQSIGNAQ